MPLTQKNSDGEMLIGKWPFVFDQREMKKSVDEKNILSSLFDEKKQEKSQSSGLLSRKNLEKETTLKSFLVKM